MPGNDRAARAGDPIIAPKWISADGKSFWLAWSDYQYKGDEGQDSNPDFNFVQKYKRFASQEELARAFAEWWGKHVRYYLKFNMQRFDVVMV